jgi:hypothetical protein
MEGATASPSTVSSKRRRGRGRKSLKSPWYQEEVSQNPRLQEVNDVKQSGSTSRVKLDQKKRAPSSSDCDPPRNGKSKKQNKSSTRNRKKQQPSASEQNDPPPPFQPNPNDKFVEPLSGQLISYKWTSTQQEDYYRTGVLLRRTGNDKLADKLAFYEIQENGRPWIYMDRFNLYKKHFELGNFRLRLDLQVGRQVIDFVATMLRET